MARRRGAEHRAVVKARSSVAEVLYDGDSFIYRLGSQIQKPKNVPKSKTFQVQHGTQRKCSLQHFGFLDQVSIMHIFQNPGKPEIGHISGPKRFG